MSSDFTSSFRGSYMGRATRRVDGFKKVTGDAKYAGEFKSEDLVHGVIVSSAIAKGKIKTIDAERAMRVPGIMYVLTHQNRPHISWFNRSYKDEDAPPGEHFRPLLNDQILFSQQPIALVVAETFEAARYAASVLDIDYEEETHETSLKAHEGRKFEPKSGKSDFEKPPSRGDAQKQFAAAEVKLDAHYSTPSEHHNPMELYASTVVREADGKLTIYDKTQSVVNSKQYVCKVFGLKSDNVTVKSPFMGGGFGSGLRPQYQLLLAVMASEVLDRSVRVTMTRQQMFSFGHRPETEQHVKLGADRDGQLRAIVHHVVAETSRFENFTENVASWSGLAYKCANVDLKYELVQLDRFTPLDMRAPGAALGFYALESAMDELAVELKMDPVDLRLKNYVDVDQLHHDRPYASKELKACYEQGASRFGWEKRNPTPRSMRNEKKLIGWGMATGIWDAMQMKASARVELSSSGHLTVASATSDIGTGTYTIMAQIGADLMGLPIERVEAKLGDTTLPEAPLEGGSWTAASVGSAVTAACLKLRESLLRLAAKDPAQGPKFKHLKIDEVEFVNGALRSVANPNLEIELNDLIRISGHESLSETVTQKPEDSKQKMFGKNTHAAVFIEVQVDEDTGMVEVTRAVSAIAAGRIINPKTARSQILGGVVWGVSMALHEESQLDHNLGRYMNHNLSEYHVSVSKDVKDIDVIFVPEEDSVSSPIGVKGLGEIGIVGTAAAVANAVYHATGQRVRDLPITPDKILRI